MAINIFEAGRRAAKVFLGLVLGTGALILLFGNGNDREMVAIVTCVIAGLSYGGFLAVGWIVRGLLGIPNGKDFRQ